MNPAKTHPGDKRIRRKAIPLPDELLLDEYLRAGLNQVQIRQKYAMCGRRVSARLRALGIKQNTIVIGGRYGKWTVLARAGTAKRHARFSCKCDCGTVRQVTGGNILSGNSLSCGCAARQAQRKKFTLPNDGAAVNVLLRRYKNNAASRGLQWGLEPELFNETIRKPCYYCGKQNSNLHSCARTGKTFLYNGIDRADNSRGYFPDNIVPCCRFCNNVKGVMPQAEFVGWAVSIASRCGGSK